MSARWPRTRAMPRCLADWPARCSCSVRSCGRYPASWCAGCTAPKALPRCRNRHLDGGGGWCHDRSSTRFSKGNCRVRGLVATVNALLAALLAGPVLAVDTVTWLTSDLPPQYIAEGELSGMGIKDQQLRLISATFPDLQHRTMR